MAVAEKIPLEELQSSNISGAGYKAEKRILAVRFKSGDIFHYAGVSTEMALAFYAADSKGRYYAEHIKGKFNGQKMTGKCPKCGDGPGWLEETCSDCGTAVYADAPKLAAGR